MVIKGGPPGPSQTRRLRSVWISWEKQRRSVTLAQELGARPFILLERSDSIPFRLIRYAHLIIRTLLVLTKERAQIVYCQNPSIVLAALLCLIRPLFRFVLVVDRHSNFWPDFPNQLQLRLFRRLSDYTIRKADLTIVTNHSLATLVDKIGGRSFVLQDRIPELTPGGKITLEVEHNIAYVCSFDDDEAVPDVMETARLLDSSWRIYVTGNYRRHLQRFPCLHDPPSTILLTGFLSDQAYQEILRSVDAVLVTTKHDHTLMCGAYEAIAVGKPVIASDTQAMKDYFTTGFVFTNHHPAQLYSALHFAMAHKDELSGQITALKASLTEDWNTRFAQLNRLIQEIAQERMTPPRRRTHSSGNPVSS